MAHLPSQRESMDANATEGNGDLAWAGMMAGLVLMACVIGLLFFANYLK